MCRYLAARVHSKPIRRLPDGRERHGTERQGRVGDGRQRGDRTSLCARGRGATVIGAARTLGQVGSDDPERSTLAETVHAAAQLPGKIHAQVCDMEIEADIVRAVDQTVLNFGRIDILVNNAAFMKSFRPFEIETDTFDLMMRINLRGPYLAIRQVAPVMSGKSRAASSTSPRWPANSCPREIARPTTRCSMG